MGHPYGVAVPHASGAIAVCGRCNVPIELHPHESCEYEYVELRVHGSTVGYYMLKKKKSQKNGLRQKSKAP